MKARGPPWEHKRDSHLLQLDAPQKLTVLRVAELQRKLKSHPQQVCRAKVRALVSKECNPNVGDGDIWVDALDNLKSLDSWAEVALPCQKLFLSLQINRQHSP